MPRKPLKAIDLYAGVGGWSLGLKAAGIGVVGAYEIWPDAVATYNANLSSRHSPIDLRTISFRTLPKPVDLVVGSPPCTEFSFSNRGGNGDIAEGLKHVIKFLQIVEYLQPTYWILENVPRVARIIRESLEKPGSALFRFRHLAPTIQVLNFACFGLPQSRHRCLLGTFPFALLHSYADIMKQRSLGDVIAALRSHDRVTDPVWGGTISGKQLSEMEPESCLAEEQLRMNREAKRFHPVYNDMCFPDDLELPARTITATCTRVSRESIIIRDPETHSMRRLTVRERASLQGFPLTFQFFAKSHDAKIKMIGNAVPPLISFLAGMAVTNASIDDVSRALGAGETVLHHLKSVPLPPLTPPATIGKLLPAKRRFRAAIPGLRFKSGMRFELANEFSRRGVRWRVRFYYGPSTDIRTTSLSARKLQTFLTASAMKPYRSRFRRELLALHRELRTVDARHLQQVWAHRSVGTGPYEITDRLGAISAVIGMHLHQADTECIKRLVLKVLHITDPSPTLERKVARHARCLVAGFVVGSVFNQALCASFKKIVDTPGRITKKGCSRSERTR